MPRVVSVVAGLGSRDVDAGDLAAVFDWLADARSRASRLSASSASATRSPCRLDPIDIRPPGAFSVRGHSIGGFGSITTNKLLATLIGEVFGKQVQAYPRYGSEKKGLPTTYYLTIADEPIRGHAELHRVDLVPLHDVAAFALGDPLAGPGRRRDGLHPVAAHGPGGDLGVDPAGGSRAEIVGDGSGSPRSIRPRSPARARPART